MKKEVENLKAGRVAAGAAYAAAAKTLAEAWVELAAYDSACGSTFTNLGQQPSFGERLVIPLHGEFLRAPPIGDVFDLVRARNADLTKPLASL